MMYFELSSLSSHNGLGLEAKRNNSIEAVHSYGPLRTPLDVLRKNFYSEKFGGNFEGNCDPSVCSCPTQSSPSFLGLAHSRPRSLSHHLQPVADLGKSTQKQ
jgi:hypothetical protein